MKALLILVLGVSASALAANDLREFPAPQVKGVEVRNSSGKIEIVATQKGQAVVEANRQKWSPKCQLDIQHNKAEGLLKVEVEDQSWVMDNDCEVNLKISIPTKVSQKIFSGSGDVMVNGTNGALEVKSGSGDVTIDAIISQLNVVSGSGKMEIKTHATNSATLRSGSGNIRLTYTQAPTGELNISSGSGDVDVYLPKGSSILTELISASGKTQSEIPNSRGGKLKISGTAGSGDLQIRATR